MTDVGKRDFYGVSIRGMVAYCVLCLENHGIPLPDFELVRGFPFSEFHGWGARISPEGLSRII